jgi:hypothetical protein
MHLPLEIIQLIKEECDLHTQQTMTEEGLGWITEKERRYNLAEYLLDGQKEYRIHGHVLNKNMIYMGEDAFGDFVAFNRCIRTAQDIVYNIGCPGTEYYLNEWYEESGKWWDGYEFYQGPINMKSWIE